MPDYISLSTNKGELPKNEREWLLDNNSVTELSLTGNDIWIQLEINPGNAVPEITKINLSGSLEFSGKPTPGWKFVCSGSDDGITWTVLGKAEGIGFPERNGRIRLLHFYQNRALKVPQQNARQTRLQISLQVLMVRIQRPQSHLLHLISGNLKLKEL